MDEPDNAFHPEMQKNFIKELNDFLTQYEGYKFHVIMTTHSPIITSDLTSNHVIFLAKEMSENSLAIRSIKNKYKPKTFARNIYELYKDSFFIEGGLIGFYADNILSSIYKQFNNENKMNEDEANNTLQMYKVKI